MEDNKDKKNKEQEELFKDLDKNLLGHDYDGITELDNNLPPWWLYMFWGTINFAIIYLVFVFLMGEFDQFDELKTEYEDAEISITRYQEEKRANSEAAIIIDENNVTLATEAFEIESGKTVYTRNCVSCHGPQGGGGVGPNMTDAYWLHGSKLNDIFKVVKYGVPEKGMIPWDKQLSPEQIRNVSSYILTELKDKNVEGGKAPQGTEEY